MKRKVHSQQNRRSWRISVGGGGVEVSYLPKCSSLHCLHCICSPDTQGSDKIRVFTIYFRCIDIASSFIQVRQTQQFCHLQLQFVIQNTLSMKFCSLKCNHLKHYLFVKHFLGWQLQINLFGNLTYISHTSF